MADLLSEIKKSLELHILPMPGAVLRDAVRESHSQGNHGGFIQCVGARACRRLRRSRGHGHSPVCVAACEPGSAWSRVDSGITVSADGVVTTVNGEVRAAAWCGTRAVISRETSRAARLARVCRYAHACGVVLHVMPSCTWDPQPIEDDRVYRIASYRKFVLKGGNSVLQAYFSEKKHPGRVPPKDAG